LLLLLVVVAVLVVVVVMLCDGGILLFSLSKLFDSKRSLLSCPPAQLRCSDNDVAIFLQ
jgi:hypothetical protein